MSERKSREAVAAEIRIHVAAEERAYRWVERLSLEETITKDQALEMFNEIFLSHYQDILEERSISKMCGYPLCDNALQKSVKQKYHISTKSNKVYEMEKLKLFCSTHCYNASAFAEQQIPDTPLWLRNESNRKKIKFMEKGIKSARKSIDSEAVRLEFDKIKLDDVENIRDEEEPSFQQQNTDEPDLETSNLKNLTTPAKATFKKTRLLNDEELKKPVITKTEDVKDVLEKLKSIITEWFNKETYRIVKNSATPTTNSITDNTLDISSDQTNVDKSGPADDFKQKALQFLSKNPEWSHEAVAESDEKKLSKNNKEKKHFIPTIDSKAQASIRRKIVKEKLHSCLDRLLPVLGLLHSEIAEDGFYLITDTFSYTSQNIVLKPKEWLLVIILLLKMFSASLAKISHALTTRVDELEQYLLEQNIHEHELLTRFAKELKTTLLFEDDDDNDGDDSDSDLKDNSCSNILNVLDDRGDVVTLEDGLNNQGVTSENFDMEEMD